jgi:tRNA (Thr-GGU) A37 N-methylase
MRIMRMPSDNVLRSRSDAVDGGRGAVEPEVGREAERSRSGSLRGLDAFLDVGISPGWRRADPARKRRGTRGLRGTRGWPWARIFAPGGGDRPNRSVASIRRPPRIDGIVLHVAGLSATDGTPVRDIKPPMEGFGPRGVRLRPASAPRLIRGCR